MPVQHTITLYESEAEVKNLDTAALQNASREHWDALAKRSASLRFITAELLLRGNMTEEARVDMLNRCHNKRKFEEMKEEEKKEEEKKNDPH